MNSFEQLKLAAKLTKAAADLKKNVSSSRLKEDLHDHIMENHLDKIKNGSWEINRGPSWSTRFSSLEDETILALRKELGGRFDTGSHHGMTIMFKAGINSLQWKFRFPSFQGLCEAIKFYGLKVDLSEVEKSFQKNHDNAKDDYAKAERRYVDSGAKLKEVKAFIYDHKTTE